MVGNDEERCRTRTQNHQDSVRVHTANAAKIQEHQRNGKMQLTEIEAKRSEQ